MRVIESKDILKLGPVAKIVQSIMLWSKQADQGISISDDMRDIAVRFTELAENSELVVFDIKTQDLIKVLPILQNRIGNRPFFKRAYVLDRNDQILISDISPELDYYLPDFQNDIFEQIKQHVQSELESRSVIQRNREAVQKRRQELEIFNQELSESSSKKLELLKRFVDVEEERKKSEKKMLYFLDFINQEFQSQDFIQQMLRFLWKENSCQDFSQMIGFQISADEFSWLSVYTPKVERIFYEERIDFSGSNKNSSGDPSTQLANLLKRPMGRIGFLQIESNGAKFELFYELVVGQSVNIDQHVLFFQDRMPILLLSIYNWIANKKLAAQFEIWDSIFKNRVDPIHFIDQDFNLLRSNYQMTTVPMASKKCYERLASRSEPCDGCPVLTKKTMGLVRIKDRKYGVTLSKSAFGLKNNYLVFYTDETSQDQLRKKLIQSEKMKLLGKLSKHLSHELNNPLTGLKLHADFLLQNGQGILESTLKDDLVQVSSALVRSMNILKDLSAFLGSEDVHIGEYDIREVVQSAMRLVKSVTQGIRIFNDVKSAMIKVHPGLLQQVIFNLIKNAVEAMHYKGSMKIYSVMETSQKYNLIIEDDGPGLPDYVKSKLFSPFVSTRENVGGTGLGLYIAYESCRKMGAVLRYDETYKNGARFILQFSLSRGSA